MQQLQRLLTCKEEVKPYNICMWDQVCWSFLDIFIVCNCAQTTSRVLQVLFACTTWQFIIMEVQKATKHEKFTLGIYFDLPQENEMKTPWQWLVVVSESKRRKRCYIYMRLKEIPILFSCFCLLLFCCSMRCEINRWNERCFLCNFATWNPIQVKLKIQPNHPFSSLRTPPLALLIQYLFN